MPDFSNLVLPTATNAAVTPIDNVTSFSGTLAQLTAFREFVLSSPLRGAQGTIASKARGRNPNYAQVDRHFSREIPTFVGKSRITVFADMENFLNLLNEKFAFRQFGDAVSIVNVSCVLATRTVVTSLAVPCARYEYSNFTAPNLAVQPRQSLWTLRLGVRASFSAHRSKDKKPPPF